MENVLRTILLISLASVSGILGDYELSITNRCNDTVWIGTVGKQINYIFVIKKTLIFKNIIERREQVRAQLEVVNTKMEFDHR